MTALGELVTEAKSGFACGVQDPSGIFQLRMNNVTKDSRLNLDARRRVPRTAHRKIDDYVIRPGDVLFNATNSPEGVGKSVFFNSVDEPMVFSNHFIRLRVDPEYIDAGYLWRWLQLQYQQGRFQAGCNQWVNQATFARAELLRLDIPVLPLTRQRRIAAILDQADALLAKRRQVLAHFDTLTEATFSKMFGDPVDWPGRWPMSTIGEVADSVQYGTSAKAGSAGEWPILRMGNITDSGRIDSTDLKYLDLAEADVPKYTVRRGDLLFNRTNSAEKVGKAAVVRDETRFALAGYLVRVRMSPAVDPEFVSAYLASRHGKAVRRGMAKVAVNQANISASQLKKIPIAVPPVDVQRKFADLVMEIEHQRAGLERSLLVYTELFDVLQSRAFRGEL